MKQLTELEKRSGPNAWGRDTQWSEQRFEVEASDIHVQREHYLGHNHKSYMFRHDNVGKTIVVYSSPGWTCWVFST